MSTAFIAPVAANAQVAQLLQTCGLPHADLFSTPALQLYGYTIDDKLAGVVGLECYGSIALLRSLAVAPTLRGLWLGVALMAHAERRADERDIRTLFLLTTNANTFFTRLGYRAIERAAAPPAIGNTAQFTGLCPASATLMCKAL